MGPDVRVMLKAGASPLACASSIIAEMGFLLMESWAILLLIWIVLTGFNLAVLAWNVELLSPVNIFFVRLKCLT